MLWTWVSPYLLAAAEYSLTLADSDFWDEQAKNALDHLNGFHLQERYIVGVYIMIMASLVPAPTDDMNRSSLPHACKARCGGGESWFGKTRRRAHRSEKAAWHTRRMSHCKLDIWALAVDDITNVLYLYYFYLVINLSSLARRLLIVAPI